MDITNRKIKAFIVEDVADNREMLTRLLGKHDEHIELIGYADNIADAYRDIPFLKPDLVFLDIQLDNGTSFDLLEKLYEDNSIKFEIIFVTGYGTFESVTRAISFSALDFINKPIEEESLDKAIEKAMKRIDFRQYNRQIELLLEFIQKPRIAENKIAFQTIKGGVEFVDTEQINYLMADGVISYVHKIDKTKITASKNLGHYAKLLTQNLHFFHISSSIVVNTKQIKAYHHQTLEVTLNNGEVITASRRGGQDFKKYITNNQEYNHIDKESVARNFLSRIFGIN